MSRSEWLKAYRADIIQSYSLHSGYQNFKNHGYTSGVERAALKLVELDEREAEKRRIYQETMDRLRAVSYTHLDVYKRQVGSSAIRKCMRSFSRVYSASYTDLRRYPVIRFASDYGEAIEDAKREKARADAAARSRRKRR